MHRLEASDFHEAAAVSTVLGRPLARSLRRFDYSEFWQLSSIPEATAGANSGSGDGSGSGVRPIQAIRGARSQ